jgi:putative transposase
VPRRVPGDVKDKLLAVIDEALTAGWSLARICGLLEVDRARVWRWQARRAADRLDDLAPGGNPIHGLLDWEVAEILALAEEWGPVDRSHRKLAHRGSYLDRVWVSPSTVDRVLAAHGLVLPGRPRPVAQPRRSWPEWVEYRPNQVWGWDVTHFGRCRRSPYCFGIIDLVSRKWIATLLSAEESSTQVRVLFLDALDAEGLLPLVEERLDHPAGVAAVDLDDERVPILLAVSDNGPAMTSHSTREFMALCSIAQHFGRPGVPTDQAHIESLWGHVKAEWPHLCSTSDPAVLGAELERVRAEYNGIRLHETIGYVTPNDEHQGRGHAIRQARRHGMLRAAQRRKDHHRTTRTKYPETHP